VTPRVGPVTKFSPFSLWNAHDSVQDISAVRKNKAQAGSPG
jgi:hypothetical protein